MSTEPDPQASVSADPSEEPPAPGGSPYEHGVLYAEVQSDGSLVHRPGIPLARGLHPTGPGEGRTVSFVPPIDETAEPTLDAMGNAIYPLQDVELVPGAAIYATGVFDGDRFIADTLSIYDPTDQVSSEGESANDPLG